MRLFTRIISIKDRFSSARRARNVVKNLSAVGPPNRRNAHGYKPTDGNRPDKPGSHLFHAVNSEEEEAQRSESFEEGRPAEREVPANPATKGCSRFTNREPSKDGSFETPVNWWHNARCPETLCQFLVIDFCARPFR
ncbi:hypothetical protein KM043_016785 [Ampulex compressa]|nr:hypothetical protein KM043_016785 [Ampulex compressa]